MKRTFIWAAALTAVLFGISGCGQSAASVSETSASAPVAISAAPPTVQKPERPTYTIDRSGIPGELNASVVMTTSNVPMTYAQVLDDAERQGGIGELIDLTGYRLTIPQIKDVTARCLEREVLWMLDVDGAPVMSFDTELDLSGRNLAGLGINLYEIFEVLPDLTRVNLCKTGFSNADYAALQDAFPDIRIIWEIVWHHWTFRTDVVAFSTMKFCSDPFFLYDEDAQYLRYCTDLVALDLGHNHVHDWSFLQYMPNLKILIAVDNQVADLSWIKYTPKLEYLEFFVGRITDLSFLQYTPNMVDLNISYNPIRDAAYLYNLPKLERLWLEHTGIPYGEVQKLQQAYPNAKIVYEGEGSIDQGWRTHPRFYAMRDMFRNNYVHELFMDKEEESQIEESKTETEESQTEESKTEIN